LQKVDQKYEPPAEGSMVGAPGKEIWTFKALKKGQSSISMEYSQPWEGGTKAAETFQLTVVVK
jgi:inhibitor of cysteine peptidase